MLSYKTQQEVPCFIVWPTRFLMLVPYSLMRIAGLIDFSSKMCHQNCVDYSGQFCLGQAEMCSHQRAHNVHIIQSRARNMLPSSSTTSHHVQIKGVMSKADRQHNAKEYCRSEILYFSAEGVMHSTRARSCAGRDVTVHSAVCLILVETWFSKEIELVMKERRTVNK